MFLQKHTALAFQQLSCNVQERKDLVRVTQREKRDIWRGRIAKGSLNPFLYWLSLMCICKTYKLILTTKNKGPCVLQIVQGSLFVTHISGYSGRLLKQLQLYRPHSRCLFCQPLSSTPGTYRHHHRANQHTTKRHTHPHLTCFLSSPLSHYF